MKTLYFDCFSGASGDMILGALIDAGVELAAVRRALGSLAIAPDTVWTERVVRAGVGATKFHVRGEWSPDRSDVDREDGPVHGHAGRRGDDHHGHHDHHHHGHDHAHAGRQSASAVESASPAKTSATVQHGPHRTLAEIFGLIDGSDLGAAGKERAKQLFRTLGEAEAAIHDIPFDRVHLHEVGATDSIIDIVGTVFALEQLGVERFASSPLNVGGGRIHSAHGDYPVPAPATMRLLRGAPIYAGEPKAELVTPTGALLVTAYAHEFGPIPPMRVAAVGYGAGTRDFPASPNVLRVLLGESEGSDSSRTVVVIEAEIDDMNPQIFGVLMDRLLADGALDVFYTPIQMKKNRPGTLLTVVTQPGLKDRLAAVIFRETTTIGLRYREMARECLDRETVRVQTEVGSVRIKVSRRDGAIVNATPEFDDCVRLADEHHLPAKHVQALAMKAYLDSTKRGI